MEKPSAEMEREALHIFKIQFFSLKGEKLFSFVKNVIDKQKFNDKETMYKVNKLMDAITFSYVSFNISSIVKNYNTFIYENMIIYLFFNNVYPYINKRIKRMDFRYRKEDFNNFLLQIDLKINLVQMLIIMLKGELNYVGQTDK